MYTATTETWSESWYPSYPPEKCCVPGSQKVICRAQIALKTVSTDRAGERSSPPSESEAEAEEEEEAVQGAGQG